MAKHEVGISVGPVVLPKKCIYSGVSVIPTADGNKLGELYFGQGGVSWKPMGKQKVRNWNWSDFADIFNAEYEK